MRERKRERRRMEERERDIILVNASINGLTFPYHRNKPDPEQSVVEHVPFHKLSPALQ